LKNVAELDATGDWHQATLRARPRQLGRLIPLSILLRLS